MSIWNVARWAIAVALVVLSFANASWLAPEPKGSLRLIAARPGGAQCPSLENVRSAFMAGGDAAVIDEGAKAPCVTIEKAREQLPRYTFLVRTGDRAAQPAFTAAGSADTLPWNFTIAQGRRCFADYVLQGWLTITPASCRNGTILVPIDQKWKVAGWPRRFQARMAEAGTRVILTGPAAPDDAIPGLSKLEEIPEIPRVYTGYAWIDDIELIGRSIRR